jgi:YebC/PmpR family DNA-binding regulatory protein
MFKRFDKMSKAFTRIGKEIAIAVKLGGADPDNNPRLRAAIQNSKAANMPKDRVEAAIKRAGSKDEANLEEIVYEGYGPFGVAIVIETATDNPTRTVANIRSYFNKHDGTLATTGSLEFLFNRRGVFKVPIGAHTIDDLELELIDAGAEDVEHDTEENLLVAYSDFNNFGKMQRALEDKKIEVLSSEMVRLPLNTVALTDEQMEEIAKLLERIEEDDDVQNVFDNIG